MLSRMLSREEVLKIAKLARLQLTEEEVASYQKKLGRVLDYVTELKSIETPKDAAFVRHIPRDAVAFREDKAVNFAGQKALLENAPATEGNCFLLPAIMEGD
jgi:aspartyl-tRNA(Asn)/glutamyl-tRNA(Gln) amidotransferase subunit C